MRAAPEPATVRGLTEQDEEPGGGGQGTVVVRRVVAER
jgi:hypothetical protein